MRPPARLRVYGADQRYGAEETMPRDPDGRPVRGCQASVAYQEAANRRVTVRGNSASALSIPDADRVHEFFAWAEGLAPVLVRRTELDLARTGQLELSLLPACVLEGQVMDRHGRPCPALHLLAKRDDRHQRKLHRISGYSTGIPLAHPGWCLGSPVIQRAVTTVEGSFRIADLPLGPVEIRAGLPEALIPYGAHRENRGRFALTLPQDSPWKLAVDGRRLVTLLARNHRTDQPLPHLWVAAEASASARVARPGSSLWQGYVGQDVAQLTVGAPGFQSTLLTLPPDGSPCIYEVRLEARGSTDSPRASPAEHGTEPP